MSAARRNGRERFIRRLVYLFALVNPNDQYHVRAVEHDLRGRPVVTSRYVLFELADGFCRRADRQRAVDLIDALEGDATVRIIPADEGLYAEALALYRRRPDKDWSLTDCASFVVMRREGISEVLTADHHFEQAGFTALLK